MKLILSTIFILAGIMSFNAQEEHNCDDAYTIYNSALKEGDFHMAYLYWQRLVDGSCDEKIREKHLIISNGGLVIGKLIRKASPERKEQLLDSLLFNYQKGLELIGPEPWIQEALGISIAKYRPDHKKVKTLLDSSIRSLKERSNSMAIWYYFQAVYELNQADSLQKETVLDYLRLKSICNDALSDPQLKERSRKGWEQARSFITSKGSQLLTCQLILEIYQPLIKENPDSISLREEAMTLMDERNCILEGGEMAGFYVELLSQVLIDNPSDEGYFNLARYHFSLGEKAKSEEALNKAYDLSEPGSSMRLRLIEFGALSFGGNWWRIWEKDFPGDGRPWLQKARKAAEQVHNLEVDPDLVMRRLAYCKAIEYCQKAIAIDESVRREAEEQIQEYRKHLPTCNELFQRGILEGSEVVLEVVGTVKACCRVE